MRRYFVVSAVLCALALALTAGPALANGLPGSNGGVVQSVGNNTKQENEAWALNVPIASGNNVALVNGGNQTASAETSQHQSNTNSTTQTAGQSGGSSTASSSRCGCDKSGGEKQSVGNETKQENEAGALNVPIASGNNVALVNGGNQTASAGTSQHQSNSNTTNQNAAQTGSSSGSNIDSCGCGPEGEHQSVGNETKEENEALAVNVPIASGNNVALVNTGSQSASAGIGQEQTNKNETNQTAAQTDSAGNGGQSQSVHNKSKQENEAWALNVPIASGNNVALVNGGGGCGCDSTSGGQKASAGTSQHQSNSNTTTQTAGQTGGSSESTGDSCGCKSGGLQQWVGNETKQENEAGALNAPILSGNNAALVNGGSQTASAGTQQHQSNSNTTTQTAGQTGVSGSSTSSSCGCEHSRGQHQSVWNSTKQENEAWVGNVPVASGNNLAFVNGGGGCGCVKSCGCGTTPGSDGGQTASAGTYQQQSNTNTTEQHASQTGGSSEPSTGSCGCKHAKGTRQSVRNRTKQENEAWAGNVPIYSGNNLAWANGGKQSASAGASQRQWNTNSTQQIATQTTTADSEGTSPS